MNRIRVRIIILTSWLVIFYIMGRLLDPGVISITTIVIGFIMVVSGILFSGMPGVPVWAVLLVPITALLVTDNIIGNFSGDLAIARLIIEVFAIATTTILSRWVGMAFSEFENAVATITLGQREKMQPNAIAGQESIYREVRRARNHQQPLALISIGVDEKSIKPATEKIVEEIQRSMMKQYKLRGLSKMLVDELEDCAVIVQESDHYLAVLPDTSPEELPIVVERLRQNASQRVGVEIKIGVATLPQDGYTFEGLVEKATQEMGDDREPQPFTVMDKYSIENRIINNLRK